VDFADFDKLAIGRAGNIGRFQEIARHDPSPAEIIADGSACAKDRGCDRQGPAANAYA
jgi:hypothetical protein